MGEEEDEVDTDLEDEKEGDDQLVEGGSAKTKKKRPAAPVKPTGSIQGLKGKIDKFSKSIAATAVDTTKPVVALKKRDKKEPIVKKPVEPTVVKKVGLLKKKKVVAVEEEEEQ